MVSNINNNKHRFSEQELEEFSEKPLLETAGWDIRRELSEITSENTW